MTTYRIILFYFFLTIPVCIIRAQEGFGTANPSANSIVDLVSPNKGLLLPRIALSDITLAAPLQNHVAGMFIYNTATAGIAPNAVTPGYYFNNGTKWIRLQYGAQKAWNNVATSQPADNNTQHIYQLGKVGIGTIAPQNALDIQGDGSVVPLVLKNLLNKDNSVDYKMLMINNTTGVVSYTDIPPPASFVAQNISGTQIFNNVSFSSTSSAANATVLSLSNVLIAPTFGTFAANTLTINEAGDYDILGSCNLLMPTGTANYTNAGANTFMNVTVAIQLDNGNGIWNNIAAVTNTLNYSSFGLTSTLKPVATLYRLTAGSKLRLVIYRGGGFYLNAGAAQSPQTTPNLNGVLQDKLFKVTKYN